MVPSSCPGAGVKYSGPEVLSSGSFFWIRRRFLQPARPWPDGGHEGIRVDADGGGNCAEPAEAGEVSPHLLDAGPGEFSESRAPIPGRIDRNLRNGERCCIIPVNID
jgi:hypothetical protein